MNSQSERRMSGFQQTAEAFLAMAHRIVWCTAATVDAQGRPRSRVLHPIWEFDAESLVGWIATGPTPIKLTHLQASPFISCNYWASDHDTCVAECAASWINDADGKTTVWNKFLNGPEPVGYDPSTIPAWDRPESPAFAGLRLDPWRLRVMPGSVMMAGSGETLVWNKE
jgi:hypothetical protein